jgi:hypothetical protein
VTWGIVGDDVKEAEKVKAYVQLIGVHGNQARMLELYESCWKTRCAHRLVPARRSEIDTHHVVWGYGAA